MAQFGQVAWHSPGAAIGPDSGPEVGMMTFRSPSRRLLEIRNWGGSPSPISSAPPGSPPGDTQRHPTLNDTSAPESGPIGRPELCHPTRPNCAKAPVRPDHRTAQHSPARRSSCRGYRLLSTGPSDGLRDGDGRLRHRAGPVLDSRARTAARPRSPASTYAHTSPESSHRASRHRFPRPTSCCGSCPRCPSPALWRT